MPPPTQISPEVRQYLDDELNKIAEILNSVYLHLDPQSSAPARPSNGVLAYADGTNWNPGAGAGVYAYIGGTWTKL